MANLFDEEQGSYLRMNAIKYLQKPPEVQREDDPFITNGSLAITYILVATVEEYQNNGGLKFQPSYVHQVFRSSNEIYGYKDLNITIYVTALGLKPYIKIKFSEQTEDADDLEGSFKKVYEAGYLTSEEQFIEILKAEATQEPIGELIEEYGNFKIYKSQMNTTKGLAEFKPFVQAFLFVLIDGVQYPGEENEWVYYTLYENRIFVGLTTVYQFNLSWNHQRHRLSQMLFLPQYQRKGHGGKMLRAVYKQGLQNEKCVQITLEDPSEDFQVMRDITDAKYLKEHFCDLLPNQVINDSSELVDLPKDKLFEIIKKTKLHANQIKRVYQIYQFAYVNKKSHKLMVDYGKHLIKHLEKPYTRNKNILVRFEDGSSISVKQLNLLLLKEKEDRNINYEEALAQEFSLFELIATKLRKDNII